MTLEEARALFPVLERLAYLNAGTFGPLARPTADAVETQLAADLEHGRFGKEYFERMLDLRKQARAALGGLVGAEQDQVALTGSTTDGCNIVLAGLDLQPEDEIVTTMLQPSVVEPVSEICSGSAPTRPASATRACWRSSSIRSKYSLPKRPSARSASS